MTNYFREPIYRTFLWQTVGFGGLFLLREQGVDHINQPFIQITFFSLLIVCLLKSNPDIYHYLTRSLKQPWKLLQLFAFYLSLWIIYSLFNPPESLLQEHQNVHFAYLSHTYMMTKSADILFQQLAFAMFVLDLNAKGVSRSTIQGISSGLLTVSHLATLYSLPIQVSVYFIMGGAIAGFVFPTLILNKSQGLISAYLVHWLFYVCAGILFNASLGTLYFNA